MTRIQSLLIDLRKATLKLQEASEAPETELNRDATIQRFEFTFELAWKLMNAILKDNDINAYGPKNTFRYAARLGLIHDPLVWFKFHEVRNLTTHKYDEITALKCYQTAKAFVDTVKQLIETASTHIDTPTDP